DERRLRRALRYGVQCFAGSLARGSSQIELAIPTCARSRQTTGTRQTTSNEASDHDLQNILAGSVCGGLDVGGDKAHISRRLAVGNLLGLPLLPPDSPFGVLFRVVKRLLHADRPIRDAARNRLALHILAPVLRLYPPALVRSRAQHVRSAGSLLLRSPTGLSS